VWFQLHWFIGITAGTVLVVIGLSGATLAFKDELLDLMNPGVRHVPVETRAPLTPGQLSSIAAAEHGQRVASITLYAEAGAAPRVFFAPKQGQRRGASIYMHPYTGATQPALAGAGFFEWTESLHRWLLLPREQGRQVAGALALCLLGLALSGLYLRWPRRPLDWRTWLTFDPALKGRSFLWNLHAVAGTWCLVVYVALTLTGIYWSYDVVRDNIDAWAGKPPRVAQARGKKGPSKENKETPAVDIGPAWTSFQQYAPGWTLASVRLPTRPDEAVQFTWLAADAPHERARSRMDILPADGKVTHNAPYSQQGLGARLVNIIYPLHMGTYFGLPGRIIVTLASLGLPLFAITGWMLYLGRRKAKRAVQAQRAMLAGTPGNAGTGLPTLVAYASQSGQAERLALESARALQQAGVAVDVQSLDQFDPAQLRRYERALIVASTFGEGEAPDGTRRFARLLQATPGTPLAGLEVGVLALGDRHYSAFCGFGHALEQQLHALGATPLFPLIEVDKHDPAALAAWSQALARCSGSAIDAIGVQEAAAYGTWHLTGRVLLNPGSLGGELHEITLAGRPGRPGKRARWPKSFPAMPMAARATGIPPTMRRAAIPSPRCRPMARCNCWCARKPMRAGTIRAMASLPAGSRVSPRRARPSACACKPIPPSPLPWRTCPVFISATVPAWPACARTCAHASGRDWPATGCCSANASKLLTASATRSCRAGWTMATWRAWTASSRATAPGTRANTCRTACAPAPASCAPGWNRAPSSACAAACTAWRPVSMLCCKKCWARMASTPCWPPDATAATCIEPHQSTSPAAALCAAANGEIAPRD